MEMAKLKTTVTALSTLLWIMSVSAAPHEHTALINEMAAEDWTAHNNEESEAKLEDNEPGVAVGRVSRSIRAVTASDPYYGQYNHVGDSTKDYNNNNINRMRHSKNYNNYKSWMMLDAKSRLPSFAPNYRTTGVTHPYRSAPNQTVETNHTPKTVYSPRLYISPKPNNYKIILNPNTIVQDDSSVSPTRSKYDRTRAIEINKSTSRATIGKESPRRSTAGWPSTSISAVGKKFRETSSTLPQFTMEDSLAYQDYTIAEEDKETVVKRGEATQGQQENVSDDTPPSVSPTPSTTENQHLTGLNEQEPNDQDDSIVWGRICSPRLVLTPAHQDVSLRCEVWVPYGTTVTWIFDSQVLRSDSYETNNSQAIQGVHSTLYLDCASDRHVGQYRMQVESPSGHTRVKYFTVVLLSPRYSSLVSPGGGRGLMCGLENHLRRMLPRIHSFTKAVYTTLNSTVALPCRYDGDYMKVEWFYEDNQIVGDENISVDEFNGDLIIDDLRLEHRGRFMCELVSNVLPRLPQFVDRVITSLQFLN